MSQVEEKQMLIRQEQSLKVPHKFAPLDIPTITKALKEVYTVGSIPLVLLFVAAVVIFGLLARGVLETLPQLVYLVGFLIACGVIVFLIINWLAYRRWRDEVNTRTENRRLEMDLYLKLSTSNVEIQDKFLLSLLQYTGELASRPGSTPEGRREEIKYLSDSLGTLVREFVNLRGQLRLPDFTSAIPLNNEVSNTAEDKRTG